jgi:uncharacterized metal-binding protein
MHGTTPVCSCTWVHTEQWHKLAMAASRLVAAIMRNDGCCLACVAAWLHSQIIELVKSPDALMIIQK